MEARFAILNLSKFQARAIAYQAIGLKGNAMRYDFDRMLKQLQQMREEAHQGGGPERRATEIARGKFSARERIELLLDKDTFEEVYTFAKTLCTDFGMDKKQYLGDGIVTGFGKMDSRKVCVVATDVTVLGGSGTCTHLRKWCELVDTAARVGAPMIQLNDSGGGRVQEGLHYYSFTGSLFYSNTQASGVVPQITAVVGRNAGHGVYGAALTDFVFMVDNIGEMYITGPTVIKAVTAEEVTFDELGGAKVHAQVTGIADLRLPSEAECFQQIRRLLSFLPQNCREKPPGKACCDNPKRADVRLNTILPEDPRKVYNMKEIIRVIVDDEDFFELKPEYARNIIIGFARFNGNTVGIVANQPLHLGGCLTVESSIKSARFVRFCNAFNIPLLFLIDTPGYLPGVEQEHAAIIKHGAKLLFALCEATVPKISIVIRRAYGGANVAMGANKEHGMDLVYSWPTGEFALMGPEQAAALLYRAEVKKAEDPAQFLSIKCNEYREKFSNPYYYASYMNIDDVIFPSETRWKIIHGFDLTEGKQQYNLPRRLGNIPL
jgi:acetyl-CoA carboxylase carboxyltransferase component